MKIGDRYEATRDAYQWVLTERKTYHSTLAQVCETIADREAGRCPEAMHLHAVMAATSQSIRDAVQEVSNA